MLMFKRLITDQLHQYLTNSLVVLVIGPRRAGKTTLIRHFFPNRQYITFDNYNVLASSKHDPSGFLTNLDYVTLDEIQRVPELLLAIKESVDYKPEVFGRFLLTGSANIYTLPVVADSLAGRMKTLQLLPLSQCEILNRSPTFLDQIFSGEFNRSDNLILADNLKITVLSGGFPEALKSNSEKDRSQWIKEYLFSLLHRDLRELHSIEFDMNKFFQILASYSAQIVNYSKIANMLDMSSVTVKKYITLLEQIFLVTRLSPFFSNQLKRQVKTPKLHFLDTGVLASTLGITLDKIHNNHGLFGSLLESFVVSEILKLINGCEDQIHCYHFSHHQNYQVDLLLERDDGQVVGIEIKASKTVEDKDFKGLKVLKSVSCGVFCAGVVLYDGIDILPFGEKLWAIPISNLWS